MNANKPIKQQGFSLLEILIAFSILALSIGILLKIFSGGVNTAIIAEDYTVATQIAESLLTRAGSEIPLKEHQSNGEENDKYHWQLLITPYNLHSEQFEPNKLPAEFYKVRVTVHWDEDDSNGRQVQLSTLKLGTKKNVQP